TTRRRTVVDRQTQSSRPSTFSSSALSPPLQTVARRPPALESGLAVLVESHAGRDERRKVDEARCGRTHSSLGGSVTPSSSDDDESMRGSSSDRADGSSS